MSIVLVTTVIGCGLLAPSVWATADSRLQDVSVTVDPRIELTSIIFRLAGHPEYNQGRITEYNEHIDAHFGPYRSHPAVLGAQLLRRTRGIGYDACMSFATHIADTTMFAERNSFDAANSALDDRWDASSARTFLAQMKDFAEVSDFAGFVREHLPLYELAESRMRAMIDTNADLEWFERFFGVEPTAPFTVAIGLANGPQSYGPRFVDADGAEHLYAIIGASHIDDRGDPYFNEQFLATIVHEFSHSFVNPLIHANLSDLRPAGERLFPLVESAMKRQAYGHWKTMFCESLVRAAVVRYVIDHEGRDAATHEIAEQESARSFLWTGRLVALLDEYETNRATYPTLKSFMPRIVTFFDDIAPTIEGEVAAREAARPQLVTIAPWNNAENVDPALDSIVIVFDRPMASGYSVVHDQGAAREQFPEVLGVSWNDECTTFTMRVKLKPSRTYRFALNWEDGGNFRSAADDIPLRRTVVTFRTSVE